MRSSPFKARRREEREAGLTERAAQELIKSAERSQTGLLPGSLPATKLFDVALKSEWSEPPLGPRIRDFISLARCMERWDAKMGLGQKEAHHLTTQR